VDDNNVIIMFVKYYSLWWSNPLMCLGIG